MSAEQFTVLLVEDNPGDARLITEMLREVTAIAYKLEQCATFAAAIQRLSRGGIDVVISDLALPDSQGLDTFVNLQRPYPGLAVLILTGLHDETLGMEAVRLGAQDYLVKGHVDSHTLDRAIRYAYERKRYRDALIEEKERLLVTLKAIADAVIVTDAAGKVILLNDVAAGLTGWSADKAVGRHFGEVFRIQDSSNTNPCEDPVKKVLTQKSAVFLPLGISLLSRDGAERLIEDSAAPICDPSGVITGVVIVFRDISERKKIEQELMKVQKLEALGVLAGGIAHDFNNILTAIINSLAYSKLHISPHEETFIALTDAEKAAVRAKDITHQLMTFAKGGVPIKRTMFVGDIIHESVNFLLRGSGVKQEIDIDQKLWPVDIDAGQFTQVINNLTLNAKQAMPAGGALRMSAQNVELAGGQIKTLAPGRYIKVVVSDNGTGIPEKYLEKIFDPYFSTKQEGSGLGLAVTYSIIKHHHGSIQVFSKAGEGTTFEIYLPASERSPAASQSFVEVAGGGTVLLMDDDGLALETVRRLLNSFGYEARTAKDGAAAVDIYRQSFNEGKHFDAVILDLVVPGGLSGHEAAAQIIKIDPQAKLILSSGYCDDPVIVRYKDYGFSAVIPKPYQAEALREVLGKVIRGK